MKKFFKAVGLIILALVGFSFFSVATNPVANAEKKMFMAGELYYTKNVTMSEVDKLGNFFVKEQMFDNTKKSIMFDKEDGVYIIKIVIKKGIESDMRYIMLLEMMAERTAKALGVKKLDFHLCDSSLNTLRVIPFVS
jgi:hypothetical protein